MQSEDITTWPARLQAAIESTFINRVMVFQETLSTQDAAARACIGLHKNHQATIVVASQQLMGRGQRANNWHDAPGCTLPCSIALGPELLNLNNPNLAARAGLAALDTIQHFVKDSQIKVKWPNDIVTAVGVSHKKIAGVLIEHARDSIVLGIGINCSQSKSDFHTSIKDTAVSLKLLGQDVPRIDLACQLIKSLNHWLTTATETDVVNHWKQHDAIADSIHKFVHNNQPHTGKVLAIDPLNEIKLQTPQGVATLPVEQTRLIQ